MLGWGDVVDPYRKHAGSREERTRHRTRGKHSFSKKKNNFLSPSNTSKLGPV